MGEMNLNLSVTQVKKMHCQHGVFSQMFNQAPPHMVSGRRAAKSHSAQSTNQPFNYSTNPTIGD